ncbi:MAG: hypothetical protein P8Y71_06990, partial [Pseudolabrys sp.]
MLRFRLMVKRGLRLQPQASEGEAQHGPFCWTSRMLKNRVWRAIFSVRAAAPKGMTERDPGCISSGGYDFA